MKCKKYFCCCCCCLVLLRGGVSSYTQSAHSSVRVLWFKIKKFSTIFFKMLRSQCFPFQVEPFTSVIIAPFSDCQTVNDTRKSGKKLTLAGRRLLARRPRSDMEMSPASVTLCAQANVREVTYQQEKSDSIFVMKTNKIEQTFGLSRHNFEKKKHLK